MNRTKVVITGIGIVCSMGKTVAEFGDALFAGKTCIGPIEGWEITDKRYTLGGQYRAFDLREDLPNADAKRLYRFSQFSLVAAHRAISDSNLQLAVEDRDSIGTSFSTVAAGLSEAVEISARKYFARGDRSISPTLWSEFIPSACTTHVAIHFGLHGPAATHSAGCVSGLDTLNWGVMQIREGNADVMVVGGADCMFTPFMWALMNRSGILAPTPSDGGSIPRPFSADHDGIALVEGGTAIILESEQHARLRGARIYGEVLGVASTEEARTMTDLDDTGKAFAVTIKKTLKDAGIPARDIDWVCAHGTGHKIGDVAESRGIETALKEHAFCVPVSSIRGAVGQSFASGGGFQAAAACLAISNQMIPPTLNFSTPAFDCKLDYVPNIARISRVRNVLINVAGVGGTHAGAIIGKYGI